MKNNSKSHSRIKVRKLLPSYVVVTRVIKSKKTYNRKNQKFNLDYID